MRRLFHWDKKYLYWGITGFCVVAAAILFYMALRFLPDLREGLSAVGKILSPFIWGFVITYLLAPLMRWLERKAFGPMCRRLFRSNKKTDGRKLARALSVILAEIILLALLVGLVLLILPKLIGTITEVVENRQVYIDYVGNLIAEFNESHPQISEQVVQKVNEISGDINAWVDKVAPNVTKYLGGFMQSAYVVLRGLYNLIIGVVVSVYVLSDLENFTAAIRRWIYSVFSLETAEKLRDAIAFTDRTFMGFITGKLLDSAIIGLLCYIGCLILGIPDPELMGAIVGVTNVIPFFGPFIGAIPCAFFILVESPIKCLIFIIFVIILQQIDGNIIGPKILGGRLGISDFWILVSITVFSGLFGFTGMILGVPVFTVIYTLIAQAVNKALKKKNHTLDLEPYYDAVTVADIDRYRKDFQEPTVFSSGDTFETVYDPDDEFEYEDSAQAV